MKRIEILLASLALAGCSATAQTALPEPTATVPTPTAVSPTTVPTTVPTTRTTVPPRLYRTVTASADALTIYSEPNGPVTHRLSGTVLVSSYPVNGWLWVSLPVRPNGSTGWVKAADVQLAGHDWRIAVSLSERRLRAYLKDELRYDFPIAVAKGNTPTPNGAYFTTRLLQQPNPAGAYGPFVFELSGFSEVLQTFNGGPGQLGIHGTDHPELIGQQVSNGCIRLRNEDVTALAAELSLGVPVEVHG